MGENLLVNKTKKMVIVDDHQLILHGTLDLLRQKYPEAEIATAKTAQEALNQIQEVKPDLVLLDLSLPEKSGLHAETETGLKLLKTLMTKYPELNLMVQSSYVKALVRVKHEIDNHQGGFAIADKNIDTQAMLSRVDIALQGATHTKDIKTGMELKPEWLEVLSLAFEEGLGDTAIAKRLNVSERTVRHYWTKIQDVLAIYPEDCKESGKNLRIQTEIRAREEGLID